MELIVTMAISSIMFAIVGAIFLTQSRYHAAEDAINQAQYQGFQALDTIGLYTDSARRVVSSRIVNGRAYESGTSTVVLELPSVDASGNILSGAYDYVALGIDPSDKATFILDIDAATGSDRIDGTYVKASLVDKLIFRYNTVNVTTATSIDVFVRTAISVRNRTHTKSLGKIYYLHSS